MFKTSLGATFREMGLAVSRPGSLFPVSFLPRHSLLSGFCTYCGLSFKSVSLSLAPDTQFPATLMLELSLLVHTFSPPIFLNYYFTQPQSGEHHSTLLLTYCVCFLSCSSQTCSFCFPIMTILKPLLSVLPCLGNLKSCLCLPAESLDTSNSISPIKANWGQGLSASYGQTCQFPWNFGSQINTNIKLALEPIHNSDACL